MFMSWCEQTVDSGSALGKQQIFFASGWTTVDYVCGSWIAREVSRLGTISLLCKYEFICVDMGKSSRSLKAGYYIIIKCI